jgi:hypothetical protein
MANGGGCSSVWLERLAVAHEVAGSNPVSHPIIPPLTERDETRPIQCVACGRSFASPRWLGLNGPLCAACHDRLQREERVRLHHTEGPRGVRAWLRHLLGR